MNDRIQESSESQEVIDRLKVGGSHALSEYLNENRERLKNTIQVHGRLGRRVDESDIIQETYLHAVRQLDNYIQEPKLPLFLWLRRICKQTLSRANRFHVTTEKRSLGREEFQDFESRAQMLADLSESMTGPRTVASKRELATEVANVLAQLSAKDREILLLRHIEELSLSEVAIDLGISLEAAKKRYRRALERLRVQAKHLIDN